MEGCRGVCVLIPACCLLKSPLALSASPSLNRDMLVFRLAFCRALCQVEERDSNQFARQNKPTLSMVFMLCRGEGFGFYQLRWALPFLELMSSTWNSNDPSGPVEG